MVSEMIDGLNTFVNRGNTLWLQLENIYNQVRRVHERIRYWLKETFCVCIILSCVVFIKFFQLLI